MKHLDPRVDHPARHDSPRRIVQRVAQELKPILALLVDRRDPPLRHGCQHPFTVVRIPYVFGQESRKVGQARPRRYQSVAMPSALWRVLPQRHPANNLGYAPVHYPHLDLPLLLAHPAVDHRQPRLPWTRLWQGVEREPVLAKHPGSQPCKEAQRKTPLPARRDCR